MENIEQYLNEFFKELQIFPGPWHIEDQGGNSVNVHSSEFDNFEVCAVWNAGPECLDEDLRAQCQANSKLIARAPDLLRSTCRTYLLLLVKFPFAGSNSTVKEIRISLDSTMASLRNEISIATGLECQHIQDTFEDWAYKINH